MRLFRLDLEKVMEELREFAREAVARGALAVVLIGSLARGDYTAFSDADVVIVAETDRGFLDRPLDFVRRPLSVDLDVRVYTPRELAAMAREGRRLAAEIATGVLLAGDGELLRQILEGYKWQPTAP